MEIKTACRYRLPIKRRSFLGQLKYKIAAQATGEYIEGEKLSMENETSGHDMQLSLQRQIKLSRIHVFKVVAFSFKRAKMSTATEAAILCIRNVYVVNVSVTSNKFYGLAFIVR
jgi:hypothetical protein